jgi:signal transduction histidine kinase
MAIGNRLNKAREGVDREKLYPLAEAIKMVKDRAKSKFDETIEISMNLGIDPRHADQNVRGVVMLPHGTGKSLRVAVFARGERAVLRVSDRGPGVPAAERERVFELFYRGRSVVASHVAGTGLGLAIVGDGPQRSLVEALSRRCRPGRVRFELDLPRSGEGAIP